MQLKCPNCGHEYNLPVSNPTESYCPNCGALMPVWSEKRGAWKGALLTLVLVLLMLVSLAGGALGGCLILVGGFEGGSSSLTGLAALCFGGGLVLAGLCIWGLTRIKK